MHKDIALSILSHMNICDVLLCVLNHEYKEWIHEYVSMYIRKQYPLVKHNSKNLIKRICLTPTHCMVCLQALPIGNTIVTQFSYFTTSEHDEYQVCNYCIECCNQNPEKKVKGRMPLYRCPFTHTLVPGFPRYNI